MSTVMEGVSSDTYSRPVKGKTVYEALPKRDDGLPRVPWVRLGINLIIGVAIFTAYRLYIEHHAFTVGLDYFEPEFQVYYMRLLYAQLALITFGGAYIMLWVWFTRPKEITMSPKEELAIYYLMFGIFAISTVFAVLIFGIFLEADAAWHQVTIRDTDFTPTHIQLFYMAIPVAVVGLAASALWIHTRMPDFVGRISVPLILMAGAPLLIMPNLGFNEWGHTFFYAEELFAAPIHWGFVTLGWGLFGSGGFLIQCVARVRVLSQLEEDGIEEKEEAKAIAA